VATGLLAVALALGTLQFYEFAALSFVPSTDHLELRGRVLDDTSAPVVDALVEIQGSSNSGRTDGEGNFTLTDVPVGKTTLVVTKEGYKTSTFTTYVAPTALGSHIATSPGSLQIPPGQGTYQQDLSTARDAFVNSCLVALIIGLVLTLMGLVSLLGRRRYRHALLGGIGAMVWALLFLGPLLGFAAIFLIYGAREEFQDSRPLFGASEVVPLQADRAESGSASPMAVAGEAIAPVARSAESKAAPSPSKEGPPP
jgi:hypothetical protein